MKNKIKYNLLLSKEQLKILNNALHVYTRIDTGQFRFALDRWVLASDEDLAKLTPKQQDLIQNISKDHDLNTMWGKTTDGTTSYDMHQAIRHQLWKEDENSNEYTVDSSVIIMGSGPEILITKK